MLTNLSLFSGIGGLDIAAEKAGIRTIGQCEYADFPYEILCRHWPDVPKWRDVRDVKRNDVVRRCGQLPTIVSGGFPCQPHSFSGKRLASADERDLWSELFRVFCETDAKWLVGENVGGLLSSENGRFFGRVLRDLAEVGCDAFWYCFPAHAAGAEFWGERVALVATTNSVRFKGVDVPTKIKSSNFNRGYLEKEKTGSPYLRFLVARTERNPSGGIHRNDDGIPRALDRMKAHGNSVYWPQFYPIYKSIAILEQIYEEAKDA